MPISTIALAAGANKTLMSYAQNKPIDQFTTAQPFSKWLMAHKKESTFGNGIFNEKVRISNSSNYQNYTREDQVTYNTKDTVRLAPFQHFEAHDGFGLNETDLSDNGIVMTDERSASSTTESEVRQIINLLEENYETLKNGFQANFDQEVHRDGTQSTKAVPGLDLLVSTTPTTGVIGGLDSSLNTFWQNRVNLSIAASLGTLTQAMEKTWRDCMTVGGLAPDAIFMGSKAFDAYRNDAPTNVNRQFYMNQQGKVKGGFVVDNGAQGDGQTSGVYFKGVEVVWDPIFDVLQALLAPTIPWDKRIYFLNSKTMKLRPNKGRWLINRKPSRMYDRYVHYFGLTADYGMTINQRNNLAVLSVA